VSTVHTHSLLMGGHLAHTRMPASTRCSGHHSPVAKPHPPEQIMCNRSGGVLCLKQSKLRGTRRLGLGSKGHSSTALGPARPGPSSARTLTLHNDEGGSVDAVHTVGRKAGVLPAVALDDVLDVEATRGGDIHPRVYWQGRPVTSCPGDLWQRMACGTTLQGDTLAHQHLCVLRLDYKSGSGCHRQKLSINLLQFHETFD
jgi:hypothetical protein